MSTVTLEEAQSALSDLIHRLGPGEEVVITEGNHPVAKIVASETSPPCQFGALKGTVLFMAPDFDAPLDVFQEYMP